MKTVIRLLICCSFIVLVSCKINISREDWDDMFAKLHGDHPETQATCSHNPFNDVVPGDYRKNSRGFYDNDIMYREPTKYMVYNTCQNYTHCHCRPPKDTLLIFSAVAPYPDSYYGTLDKYQRFYNLIAFLVVTESIDDQGVVVLPGEQVKLTDQKGDSYRVLSATLSFDCDYLNDYTPGGFEVLYVNRDGSQALLKNGRFKLIHEVDEHGLDKGSLIGGFNSAKADVFD